MDGPFPADIILVMMGIEPRSPIVGDNRSTNRATTTAILLKTPFIKFYANPQGHKWSNRYKNGMSSLLVFVVCAYC